jgi:two-component system nitrate/nitrite response regulator NarL
MPKYQVLLVDDNPVVRQIVKQVLEKDPELKICGEADDGFEALDKAKFLQPDVVVLDFSMPRMNGLDAASQLRNVLPDACLILFTLYGNPEVERAAKQAGIDAVISKADRGDALVKAAKAFFG